MYGVLGLFQGFDEVVPRSHLPLYIQTVLLPFKEKIVYDGLFRTYNIYFGGGIKRSLKESYMRAKQNNRIIESFEPTKKGSQNKKLTKQVSMFAVTGRAEENSMDESQLTKVRDVMDSYLRNAFFVQTLRWKKHVIRRGLRAVLKLFFDKSFQ